MKKNKISILIFPIIFLIISLIFFIYSMKTSEKTITNNISIIENNSDTNILVDETEISQNNISVEQENNMSVTLKAVILEVHSNRLTVMSIDKEELYNVNTKTIGNKGYKKGQEILIYYDGNVATIYPAIISNVGKIEIIKEQTDIAIPDKYLEYYNKPTNNMSVSLLSLTKNGISFIVSSEIEFSSEYSENYDISINGDITEGNLAGIAYSKKLEKKENASIEDTIQLTAELENNSNIYFGKYDVDWTQIYGELEELEERKISLCII